MIDPDTQSYTLAPRPVNFFSPSLNKYKLTDVWIILAEGVRSQRIWLWIIKKNKPVSGI